MTPTEDLRNTAAIQSFRELNLQFDKHPYLPDFRNTLSQLTVNPIKTPFNASFYDHRNSGDRTELGIKQINHGVVVSPLRDIGHFWFSGYFDSHPEIDTQIVSFLKSLGVEVKFGQNRWVATVGKRENMVQVEGDMNIKWGKKIISGVDLPLLLALGVCPDDLLSEVKKKGFAVIASTSSNEVIALAKPDKDGRRILVSGSMLASSTAPNGDFKVGLTANLFEHLRDPQFDPVSVNFQIV